MRVHQLNVRKTKEKKTWVKHIGFKNTFLNYFLQDRFYPNVEFCGWKKQTQGPRVGGLLYRIIFVDFYITNIKGQTICLDQIIIPLHCHPFPRDYIPYLIETLFRNEIARQSSRLLIQSAKWYILHWRACQENSHT